MISSCSTLSPFTSSGNTPGIYFSPAKRIAAVESKSAFAPVVFSHNTGSILMQGKVENSGIHIHRLIATIKIATVQVETNIQSTYNTKSFTLLFNVKAPTKTLNVKFVVSFARAYVIHAHQEPLCDPSGSQYKLTFKKIIKSH